MAAYIELDVILLPVELCEAVFAAISVQPNFVLETYYKSVSGHTAASLLARCADVPISVILHSDWRRSSWTTSKLSALVVWTHYQSERDLAAKF